MIYKQMKGEIIGCAMAIEPKNKMIKPLREAKIKIYYKEEYIA